MVDTKEKLMVLAVEALDRGDMLHNHLEAVHPIASFMVLNGVTVQEWIPASNPPESDEEVLVYFEYFRYGEYNAPFRMIGTSHTWNGEWSHFVNGESGWRDLKILAWMPLPEPPNHT